jgi:hypothetical protein
MGEEQKISDLNELQIYFNKQVQPEEPENNDVSKQLYDQCVERLKRVEQELENTGKELFLADKRKRELERELIQLKESNRVEKPGIRAWDEMTQSCNESQHMLNDRRKFEIIQDALVAKIVSQQGVAPEAEKRGAFNGPEEPIEGLIVKLKARLNPTTAGKYRGIAELVKQYNDVTGSDLTLYLPLTGWFTQVGEDRIFVADTQDYYEIDRIDLNGYELDNIPDNRVYSAGIHTGTNRVRLFRDLKQTVNPHEIKDNHNQADGDPAILSGKRILLVSWHEGSRAMIKQNLERCGARVDCVGGRTMATQRIKADLQRDYDLKYVIIRGVHHRTFYDAKELSTADSTIRIMVNPGATMVKNDAILQMKRQA